MTKKLLLILVIIVITACSNSDEEPLTNQVDSNSVDKTVLEISKEIEPVPQDSLKTIKDISIYFSSNRHSSTTFDITNEENDKVGTYKQIVTNEDKEGNYVISSTMEEFPSETAESLNTIKNYRLSLEEIKLIRQIDNLVGTTLKDTTIISNTKNSWINNYELGGDQQSSITSINKEVQTSFGTFSNCIEVTEITEDSREITVKTYAPNIGLIHQVVTIDGVVNMEYKLVNYYPEIFGKDIEESKNTFENIEENEYLSELPSITTGEVSKINLNDYAANVNEYSINQVEYQILHRPNYQNGKDNEHIYTFGNDIGDIQILTNNDALIKEVKFESDEPLGEEGLLYMQWLILSLNSEIKPEEANEFLFSSPSQYYEIKNFLVGLESDGNNFKFVILPNK
ncbi:hypothetical protein AB3U99_03745 [Niallia sp. JL1B1071]|uniref:hypothetical protein n=1 Tax=Niallia tiangongensis TaxID=3237105 RepID=UPI0037DD7C37